MFVVVELKCNVYCSSWFSRKEILVHKALQIPETKFNGPKRVMLTQLLRTNGPKAEMLGIL